MHWTHPMSRTSTSPFRRAIVLAGASLLLASCATVGGAPATETTTGAETRTDAWPVLTREHLDLWLHGYALLTRDTAHVPFFSRGYRERVNALKTQGNVLTQLDANRDRLASGFVSNPALVNGQFVPLYFANWEDLERAVAAFIQTGGDPRSTNDPTLRAYFAVLGGSFPAASDREWLRLFVQALGDERTRWYRSHWESEQRNRAAARSAVDSLWLRVYYPRFQRYLNNTQQQGGELLLSLPLDGEGRTVTLSQRQNAVAVGFPATHAAAVEAIYVFAHEVVNAVTNTAITDNTTPAQQRSGVVAAYSANATVRGGALLLQRIAPELVAGYMRYYLRSANRTAPAGDPAAPFESAFPIPAVIRDAIVRQLDVVLGGI